MASSPLISPEEIQYELAHYQEDNAPALRGSSIFLIIIATIAVVLRMLSRRIKAKESRTRMLGADDYSIILALLFAWGMFVAFIFCIHYGLGRHIIRTGILGAQKFGRAAYVLEAIYPVCTATTKGSILLLYRRIFTTRNIRFRYALYAVYTVLIGWAISGFFTTVFQCTPVHFAWNPIGAPCIDFSAALISLAAINTTINAAVLILPMPMVWHLHMPWQRKAAVCGIFVIGCGDVVSSVVRTYLTSRIDFTNVDYTWSTADGLLLAFVEPCLGIVCACLPVMRPIFSSIYSHVTGSIFSTKNSTDTSENRTYRGHSLSIPKSDTHPLRGQPESGWIELERQDSQVVVNQIHGNAAGLEVEGDQGSSTLPSNAIRVRSDLESFVTRQ